MATSYVRQLDGVILVFDMTNEESFNNISSWYKSIREVVDKIPCVIVGNKVDMIDTRIV